jgi:hypothetical protein
MTHPPAENVPSRRLVEQRVRNRVIEYLELAGSFEEQQEYERTVPAHIPYEVINMWRDSVPKDPRGDSNVLGVYDEAEVEAMVQVEDAWDHAATAVPTGYPPLSQVQMLPEWGRLRDAASAALSVFMRRGRMSEHHEVEN